MNELIVFSAGIRSKSGKYFEFISSTDWKEINEHIEIMKGIKREDMTIVFMKKVYRLIDTTPYVVSK